ncbi:methionine biosynthesis protein MetW [Parasphingopyxis lamellibrachiae]|uniref:Methionine biosynthesis protein MetW n=1 Tax=Parasphingopyxis lamellibrachiae TaxID=680125 RepID=A0A3D9FH49_9SPHN|nr:methionine biosynthesis protein MetW [Parasphingopyxis lamellibrachiae]RED17129.1 methionine biosynthesis protein MetW [Parasphingopyxis lamellibrachiae]
MRPLRPDLAIIASHVPDRASVLDIGCGDGGLMAALRETKSADARGLELDAADVATAMAKGLSVVQGDADTDLADYPDSAFDYAILSQTLQTTRAPDAILGELLRIAPRAFVSFPNFAYWRVRASLLFGGRMPVTGALPLSWYATENIHHVTIDDFRALLREQGIAVEQAWFLSGNRQRGAGAANLLAEQAVFLLGR